MRIPILLLTMALLPVPAAAHAMLEGATPSVGSTVPPTDTIRLHYSQGVEPLFCKVTVSPADGEPLHGAAPDVDPADNMILVLHLDKPLVAGKYRVEWHVVSVDTHQTEGSFSFTVAP